MLDKTDDISLAADRWLARFEDALANGNDGLLKTLFHPDSFWRDVLARSWNIQTINGAAAILRELGALADRAEPTGFAASIPGAAPRARWCARGAKRSRRSSNSKPGSAAATASSGSCRIGACGNKLESLDTPDRAWRTQRL